MKAQTTSDPVLDSVDFLTPTLGAKLDEAEAEFHRYGFIVLRDALDPALTSRLHDATYRLLEEPDDGYGPLIRINVFERGVDFENVIDRAPVIDFVERILGDDCHLVANCVAITSPGRTISGWHVDDVVRVRLPEDYQLPHSVRMPCTGLNLIYFLVDVDIELGPTQLVPGSHRSGWDPPTDVPHPVCGDSGPVTPTFKAGDALAYHHAIWHQGGPNHTVDGKRPTLHVSYGSRHVAQRFYPFIDYRLPERVVARSDERRKRILGLHPRGHD